MRLADLKTQALRYVVLEDWSRAFRAYGAIVAGVPSDLDARMKVADLCVHVKLADLARRVYAAIAFHDLAAGRPLHALVAAQALSSLGAEVASIWDAVAEVYGRGSARLAQKGQLGARLSPPSPDADVPPPELARELPVGDAAAHAAELAASTAPLAELPPLVPPIPLLSELSTEAFARVVRATTVQRLHHGHRVIQEGQLGETFFLVAAGQVRVVRGKPPSEVELARLGEGAVFGELALVAAQPRSASVDVVGEADLIELGAAALQAAAEELPALAEGLTRFTRDRLLKNLLATSPLFQPFSADERVELLRRFSGREHQAGDTVVAAGAEAEGLHVVLSGSLDVVAEGQRVATLAPGEAFGEVSLVRGTPAGATVRALTPATVLTLPRAAFVRLTAAMPELRDYFAKLGDERLKQNKAPQARRERQLAQFDFSDADDELLI